MHYNPLEMPLCSYKNVFKKIVTLSIICKNVEECEFLYMLTSVLIWKTAWHYTLKLNIYRNHDLTTWLLEYIPNNNVGIAA